MIKKIISGLLFALALLPLYAGHITGGYIRYDFEGIFSGYYKYNVQVILYRDCNPGFGSFDNTIPLGIFTGDTLIATQNINFNGYQDVTPLPAGMCVQVGTYSATLVLPPHSTGYTLAFQRCCRNVLVKNIYNPDWSGFTLSATIPPVPNSAPEFVNRFPVFMMRNQPLNYNLAASDSDSDVLSYELVYPLGGGSQFNPNPSPPDSPPYQPIPYEPPYSLGDIIGGVPALAYDFNTGLMTAYPDQTGIYAIAIKLTEKRNGSVLSEYRIEMNTFVSASFPVSIQQKQPFSFALSPNPASDKLQITFPEPTLFQGEILDITGKNILSFSGNEVNIGFLEKGVYLIRITSGDKSEVFKWWKN
ncbi:MAG: T9SS type A sorting domain-containing protein [Bacteroidia bacterium]|nr:T9SS type A sorting domain-containing protein [Bacteroidia bacterium]